MSPDVMHIIYYGCGTESVNTFFSKRLQTKTRKSFIRNTTSKLKEIEQKLMIDPCYCTFNISLNNRITIMIDNRLSFLLFKLLVSLTTKLDSATVTQLNERGIIIRP